MSYSNGGRIDLSEYANRDVNAMQEWAVGVGAQQSESFAITSYDGYDFFAMAGTDTPAGTCILVSLGCVRSITPFICLD